MIGFLLYLHEMLINVANGDGNLLSISVAMIAMYGVHGVCILLTP